VHVIEPLGLRPAQLNLLHAGNMKTGSLNLFENFAGKLPFYGIRFDNCKCAFHISPRSFMAKSR
jgi:hypothetical protein